MKIVIRKNISCYIGAFLLIAFVYVNSGSVYMAVYASELQQINLILATIFFVLDFRKNRLCVRKRTVEIFMFLLIIVSIVDMVIWGEIYLWGLYLSNVAVFYICYQIIKKVDYQIFIKCFVTFMTILAAISLICWSNTELFMNSFPGFYIESTGMRYKTCIFYCMNIDVPNRNGGIFWEPGMYQGFLNFALLLLALKPKPKIKDSISAVILVLTILSTYSTTGYAVMFCIGILCMYKLIYSHNKVFAYIVTILALIIVFGLGFNDTIMSAIYSVLPNSVTQKIETQNISYTTRVYSIYSDLVLSIRYPLGVGRAQANNLIQTLVNAMGLKVNARTSSITTAYVFYGIGMGIYYTVLWIRGCLRFSEKSIGYFICIIAIMAMILNSEPMFYHVFFTCVLFYWNTRKAEFYLEESVNESHLVM